MKRLLCILLVFLSFFSFMTLPSLAANTKNESLEAQSLLLDLNIISTDVDSEFMTRGEFSVALYKLLNLDTVISGYDMPYADVLITDDYYDAIYSLYVYNIISTAQTFRPDDNITASEASKMAVTALGYDFMAQGLGGYPTGYISASAKLGISVKSSGSYVTRNDAYQLLFDMLFCKLPTASYGDEIYYNMNAGSTLLEEMWNINVVSGNVCDTQYFGKNNDNGVGEGYVAIDKTLLKKGSFDTDSLFGEQVDAYYDMDKNVIVSVFSHSDDSKNITKIYSYQQIDFSDGTYSWYDENDKLQKKTISNDTLIILNGKKAPYDDAIMVPEYGFVKFVCLTSGKIDAVIINSYIQAVVGVVIPDEKLVSDKLSSGVIHSFEDEDNRIVYTDQNGKLSDFSQISENDVLWIALDNSGTVTEVKICEDVIVGELTGFGAQGSVYIDDNKFIVSDYAKKQIESSFKLGDIVKTCLNSDGEVVFVIMDVDVTSNIKVGYFMYSSLKTKGLSSEIHAKILTEDGIVNVYKFASVFSVNGLVFKNSPEQIYANLPKQADFPSSMPIAIVTYTLNKNNEITAVSYPNDIAKSYGGDTDGLFVTSQVYDDSDKYIEYTSSAGMITCKGFQRIFLDNISKRFLVPYPEDTSLAEDSDYKVTSIPTRLTKQKHTGYTDVEGDFISKYLVSAYTLGTSSSSVDLGAKTYIVDEISTVINDEGIEVDRIHVVDSAGNVASFDSERIGYFSDLNLSFGDLVKFAVSPRGYVEGVLIIYKNGEDVLSNYTDYGTSGYSLTNDGAVLNGNTGLGTISSNFVLMGNVFKLKNRFALVLTSNISPDSYDNQNLFGMDINGKTVVKINSQNKTTEKTASSSLRDYETFGNKCSKIIAFFNSGRTVEIFRYE